MPNAVVWHDIHALAEKAARVFELQWPIVFKPLLARHRCKMDGRAWRETKRYSARIALRVHRYHRPRQALRRSTIMATLAHEMAHLARGCWDHGPKHRAKTEEIAVWLREQGQPVSNMLHTGTYPKKKRKRRKK